jgi:hypothetical protein
MEELHHLQCRNRYELQGFFPLLSLRICIKTHILTLVPNMIGLIATSHTSFQFVEGGANGRIRSKTGFQSLWSHESVGHIWMDLSYWTFIRTASWMINFLSLLSSQIYSTAPQKILQSINGNVWWTQWQLHIPTIIIKWTVLKPILLPFLDQNNFRLILEWTCLERKYRLTFIKQKRRQVGKRMWILFVDI